MTPFARRPRLSPVPPSFLGALLVGTAWFFSGCGPEGGGEEARQRNVPTSVIDQVVAPEMAELAGQSGPAYDAMRSAEQWAETGEPDLAIQDYRRAIELDPELAEAHYGLGSLLIHQSFVVLGSGGRDFEVMDEGIAALLRAVELRPDDADFGYWLGRARHLRGDTENAVAELERVVALDPEHGLAHKRLGLIHRALGENERATASFALAVEHSEEDAGAHFQYGMLLEEGGELEAARDEYVRASELNKALIGPYIRLTQVLRQLGDEEGAQAAEADFERWGRFDEELRRRTQVANKAPNDAVALLAVGEMYYVVEDYDTALEWFYRAMRLEPDTSLTHLYVGIIRRRLDQNELARNHLEEAAFLEPDSLEPRLELIRLYAGGSSAFPFQDEEGRDRVQVVYEEASAIAADDADSHYLIGDVSAEVGRNEEAQSHLERALAIDAGHVPALLASGELMLEIGDRGRATERFEAALALMPESEEAQDGLARARGESGG